MTDERVVLVTGTRSGIGRHLAQHFLAAGAVVEGCSREPPGWEASRYTHHCLDVADERAVRAMIASVSRRHGRLDVTVNNAGVACMNHSLLTPAATVEGLMRTNLVGTFVVSRESAKLMRRRGFGRIVNVTTVAVPLELEGEAAYVASKSAVVGLTKVMARELAGFGITCNAVGPPPIATDLIRSVPPEKIERVLDRLTVKRLGEPDDVANVVDFFARPESDLVTGQTIYLGGP